MAYELVEVTEFPAVENKGNVVVCRERGSRVGNAQEKRRERCPVALCCSARGDTATAPWYIS